MIKQCLKVCINKHGGQTSAHARIPRRFFWIPGSSSTTSQLDSNTKIYYIRLMILIKHLLLTEMSINSCLWRIFLYVYDFKTWKICCFSLLSAWWCHHEVDDTSSHKFHQFYFMESSVCFLEHVSIFGI